MFLHGPEIAWAQPVPPASLERLVFGNTESLETIRAKYVSGLTLKLNAIDRVCQLTPDQRRRLELAGMGDIKRFFDQFFALKDKISGMGLLPEARPFHLELEMLDIKASSGLHHDRSLFGRSIRNILTPEQILRYDAMIAKDHHALTEEAISKLDQFLIGAGEWHGERRVRFQTLLRTKLEPVRNSGPYGFYALVTQIGRVDRAQYENLLPANQRSVLRQAIEMGKPREAGLRQAGFFALDEDEKAATVRPMPADAKK